MAFRQRVCSSALRTAGVVLMAGLCFSSGATGLRNASFEEGWKADGIPEGWGRYGPGRGDARVSYTSSTLAHDGLNSLQISDRDPEAESGVAQRIPAKAGFSYRAIVRARALEAGGARGAWLQIRFLPSYKYRQVSLAGARTDGFEPFATQGVAPPGTTHLRVMVYTHRAPTPSVVVDDVELVASEQPLPPLLASRRSLEVAPKNSIRAPRIAKLKNLHRRTVLVSGSKAGVAILKPASGVYDALVERIREAISARTGVAVPVLEDAADCVAGPLSRNLVILGNRSTSRAISSLYDRAFALLDLRYPGTGGWVLRTVHNPFGDGHNVVLVGGSDLGGVGKATDALVRRVEEAAESRDLSLGRLMEIELPAGTVVPKDARDLKTWDDSLAYGSRGYFGWNSISKHLAAYHMTGRRRHAREAIRLAFPDEAAKRELARVDEERIENKADPVAGAYHYNAHQMILYWDLVEESPVFSDAERLRVTNAFARQLEHDDYARIQVYHTDSPRSHVGSRHIEWAAVSHYCLARYFARDYPDPVWKRLLDASRYQFASLADRSWVVGEGDNLWWYATGIDPILNYLLLSGERAPVANGVVGRLLRGLEVLVSGRRPDPYLRSVSPSFLRKASHLTGDDRYLGYTSLNRLPEAGFRLGQSFSEGGKTRGLPRGLTGLWSVQRLEPLEWKRRAMTIPVDRAFHFAGYRSDTGEAGDYLLLDGHNGEGRNPYHAFSILGLRLGGTRLLEGVRNQAVARIGGLVEPQAAMDASLLRAGVLGETAFAVGEVPDAPWSRWRRTILQREGRYALIVDEMRFERDAEDAQVDILWEPARGIRWQADGPSAIRVTGCRDTDPAFQAARENECKTNLRGTHALAQQDGDGVVLLRAIEPGGWVEMPFEVTTGGTARLEADFLGFPESGRVSLSIDGRRVKGRVDLYRREREFVTVDLGKHRLSRGEHALRVEATGYHPGRTACFVALAGIRVLSGEGGGNSHGAFGIACSRSFVTQRRGGALAMVWEGRVERGASQVFVSVVAPGSKVAIRDVGAGKAVLLSPEEAAVSVGGSPETGDCELIVFDKERVFALGARRIGSASTPLLRSSAPVDVVWDFGAGVLEVQATVGASLALALPDGEKRKLVVRKGRQVFKGMAPADSARRAAGRRLDAWVKRAQSGATLEVDSRIGAALHDLPSLPRRARRGFPGGVSDMVWFRAGNGSPCLALSSGDQVVFLDAQGALVRTLEAGSRVRVLHDWEDEGLLLVGCVDERVLAFDREGKRRWTFVSEMDPAVVRAAKEYWFKSMPGHEGIHGLYSGLFQGGKSQAFVGSASTVEVVNPDGTLALRIPQFWGKNSVFGLLDRPGKGRSLLVGREFSGSAFLGVVDADKPDPTRRGFLEPPSGHAYIKGWESMNRRHIFARDLDGDGSDEVVGEVNGAWNRVTVWRNDGAALYSAPFGPGPNAPSRNIRDMDVGDLDGDGQAEIVVATWLGRVVALDRQCRPRWSRLLPSAPNVLGIVSPAESGPSRIVVACEKGGVYTLDSNGTPVQRSRVDGAPTHISLFRVAREGGLVAVATDMAVYVFEPGASEGVAP